MASIYDNYQQLAQLGVPQPGNYTDYSSLQYPQQDLNPYGVIATPNPNYQYNTAPPEPINWSDPFYQRSDVQALLSDPRNRYSLEHNGATPWDTSLAKNTFTGKNPWVLPALALVGGAAYGVLGGAAAGGTGAVEGAGSGVGMTAGGGALASDATLGGLADAGVGTFGAGASGAGIGAAGAAAGAGLPEIVVTGTPAAAGGGAAAAAGGGGLATSIYQGAYNGNYGQNGGLNTNSDPVGTFNQGIGTGSNAGDLANSGAIQGGAGNVAGTASGTSGSGGWLDWLKNNAGTLVGLAGGLASGGGSKNQTITTTNQPPAYLLPYLQNAASGATSVYNSGGPQYFPGQTLAPQSQATQDALQGIIARAKTGSPLVSTAQNYVQQGLQQPISSNLGSVSNPYASSVYNGSATNPYATPVATNQATNPYATPVNANMGANPYATAVTSGTQAQNPYASASNPFGGDTNPYLDQTFQHALQQAQSGVESQYARAGRNIGASAPVMGDIASQLATQIYAPAYENERNRQLQYQTQLNDIGSGAFENQQARQLQSGLAAQGIGANTFNQQGSQNLQAALAGQSIGAQGYENARSQGLQAALAGQGIGANTFDQSQAQQLQAALAGQNIGAQGFENSQNRQLSDLQSQRSFMDSLLGYASPLAAQDYANLAQLQGAGANQDLYAQQQINDAMNRWNYNQNLPTQTTNNYINQLSQLAGNAGGTTTQSQPQYQNQWANALGYAMLLQQLQNSYTGQH